MDLQIQGGSFFSSCSSVKDDVVRWPSPPTGSRASTGSKRCGQPSTFRFQSSNNTASPRSINITAKNIPYEIDIHEPISSGHLLAFCDSQFSSESIKFVLEVGKLKDYMNLDQVSWKKDWRELDQQSDFLSSLSQHGNLLFPPNALDTLQLEGEVSKIASMTSRPSKTSIRIVEVVPSNENLNRSDSTRSNTSGGLEKPLKNSFILGKISKK